MKKIFEFAVFIGFILIIGGVGGFETVTISFGKCLILTISGILITLIGCYGKSIKICRRRRKTKCNARGKSTSSSANPCIGTEIYRAA